MFILVNSENVIVAVEETKFEQVEGTGEWVDIGDPERRPNIGYTYENGAVVYPPVVPEIEHLRKMRDFLLKETDWVSGEDVPQSIKDVWFPYRQALRDITETYSSLEDAVWPTKPE
jgi:hypothetical protein